MKIMGLNSSKSYNYIRKAVLKRTKRKKYITTSILALVIDKRVSLGLHAYDKHSDRNVLRLVFLCFLKLFSSFYLFRPKLGHPSSPPKTYVMYIR